MAFQRIVRTKSGDYVYQVEAYWDSVQKKSRQRAVCLGKKDAETDALVPSRRGMWHRSPGRILDYGCVAVCRAVAHDAGLIEQLAQVFDKEQAELLFLLSVFLVSEELPLFQFETWVEGVWHESFGSKDAASSKKISGLLTEVGINEDMRLEFQRAVLKRFKTESGAVLIDTTSISTYSELDGWANYGYNRDCEPLPQVNLQLTAIEQTGMPIALRLIEGSIPDIVTLLNAIKTIRALGLETPLVKLDRGYFSAYNLELLAKNQIQILIPVPASTALFKTAFAQRAKSVRKTQNAFTFGEDTYYATLYKALFDGREYSFAFILNETRRTREMHRLFASIERVEHSFEQTPPKNKAAANRLLANLPAICRGKVFSLKRLDDGTWTTQRKNKAISRITNRMGYILLMTDIATPQTAADMLEHYRDRDSVEKLIDNFKNSLDFNRLRVHGEHTAEGKLFVGLLALMLHALLQRKLADTRQKFGRRMTPREALLCFRRIKSSTLPDDQTMISEPDKKQRKILDCLGINPDIFSSYKT
jgi:transposase